MRQTVLFIIPKQYFQTRATAKLHSELGMPNVVTLDTRGEHPRIVVEGFNVQ